MSTEFTARMALVIQDRQPHLSIFVVSSYVLSMVCAKSSSNTAQSLQHISYRKMQGEKKQTNKKRTTALGEREYNDKITKTLTGG